MHIKCSFLFYSNEGMRRWGEFDFGLKNEFFSQSLWNFLPIGPWDREGQGKNQLCEFGDRTTAFYSSWWDLFANPTQPHTRPSSPAWRTPIIHCNGKHNQTSTEPGIILKALLIVRICSQCFFIGKIKKWILSWWQWNKKMPKNWERVQQMISICCPKSRVLGIKIAIV